MSSDDGGHFRNWTQCRITGIVFTIPSRKTGLYAFRMRLYAVCMHFSTEAEKPDRSRHERTFSRFVCSVCSRFGSSSFFRHFPFKANAYNAYKCIQGRSKTGMSPTADWDSSVCTRPGRKLHTESAYIFGRIRPATPGSWRTWRHVSVGFGWVGRPTPTSRRRLRRRRGRARRHGRSKGRLPSERRPSRRGPTNDPQNAL